MHWIIYLALAAHLLLLVLFYKRRHVNPRGFQWLAAAGILAGLATATFLFPTDLLNNKFGRGLAFTASLILLVATFGRMVIHDLESRDSWRQRQRIWLGGSAIWLALFIITALFSSPVFIGQPGWLRIAITTPNLPDIIAGLGLMVAGLYLVAQLFRAFYFAPIPEIANRNLFWVFNVATLLLSVLMVASGLMGFTLLGIIGLVISQIETMHVIFASRVLDVRSAAGLVMRILVVIAIAALFILGVLLIATRLEAAAGLQTTLVLAILALLAAIIYVPIHEFVEWLLGRLLARHTINPTIATRLYSNKVSQAEKLTSLADIATSTLNELLQVQASGLLLVSDTMDDAIELQAVGGGGFADLKGSRGQISNEGMIYDLLAFQHEPVLQFDLEYTLQAYQVEVDFFRSLHMNAYAPIVVDDVFIGVLACGAKVNDTVFSQRDLQLLVTLAQQTGIALRNARLMDDLRHLNESMKSLNKGLQTAKEELEQLDTVKTDFITIASHELRTPLAQIRGYTDIIEALNEQGMLDQDQLTGLSANLRKATERTEELITAMLDVSQLDVNSMDLHFTETALENVMRMAIEPLTDAIKQRKLTLMARGLRGLPPVQADMQRLVQAFRNVIVNAVKFTPDGGRIEIKAELQVDDDSDQGEWIEVRIQDTGVGISKEHLELIFKKFYRAFDPSLHSTGAYKFMGAGPGLGLTIANGIIEGHGGKIWAESPGHDMQDFPGATFFIVLPISPPEDARRVKPFAGSTQVMPAVKNTRATETNPSV